MARVQATVRNYSPGTRTGSVLLDDGRELLFGQQAMSRSNLRGLRIGQRVRLDVEGDRVTSITLATFPAPQ